MPGGADNNESNLYIVTMCDFNTDIAILRAGVSTSIGRLNTSFTPSTGDVNKFWKHHYGIIGKANEIIVAAEALGLDDSDVLHAWSEAKFFRGRSYFELWKRFDRLYLNITPTTVDNLKREYKPASHEELMTLITTDLDDAMKGLDWSLPQNNGNVLYGRVTKLLPSMFVHRLPCGSQIGIQPLRNVRISLSRKASTRWKRKPRMYLMGQI